jgi:phospholipid transport system substrate-binding protein
MSLTLLSGVSAEAGVGAQAVIHKATDRLYAALQHECQTHTSHRESLFLLVDEILLPHADFQRMSRWVMGKYWKQSSESQRQQFVREFKQLLIRTYATAIHRVTPEDIRYLPERNSGKADKTVVRTEVSPEGMTVIPVHYHMHRKNGRWLVYDVRIEGVSLVANYRSAFSAEIKAIGIDGLIARLKQKNEQQMAAKTVTGETTLEAIC